jgi:hypothetical protein
LIIEPSKYPARLAEGIVAPTLCNAKCHDMEQGLSVLNSMRRLRSNRVRHWHPLTVGVPHRIAVGMAFCKNRGGRDHAQ